jgi:hypothetical protein
MKDILFKKLSIEDRKDVEFYLKKYPAPCISVFTFSTLVAWERIYHYQWAVFDSTLLIKFTDTEDFKDQLACPIGEFSSNLQKKIIEYARTLDYRLKIYGVSEDFINKNAEFVSYFEIVNRPDLDNYIYLSENLATLKGRKYQPKRNLLSQFERNYNWTSESISTENISDCFDVINKIYYDKKELTKDPSLSQELESLSFVLNNYSKLEEMGILIRIDGKPVAFSIYDQLNSSMCVIHYEKAIKEYKGLYQLINRETAKQILSSGYKYINREEDLGIEGLRKAKLSYNPVKMCRAQVLIFKK